jgi:hypothetical protein
LLNRLQNAGKLLLVIDTMTHLDSHDQSVIGINRNLRIVGLNHALRFGIHNT